MLLTGKGLHHCGAGAFACQPISSHVLRERLTAIEPFQAVKDLAGARQEGADAFDDPFGRILGGGVHHANREL